MGKEEKEEDYNTQSLENYEKKKKDGENDKKRKQELSEAYFSRFAVLVCINLNQYVRLLACIIFSSASD